MAAEDNPRRCYVEDTDTLAATVALMRHDNPAGWPIGEPARAPVFLMPENHLDNLLKPRTLRTELSRSGAVALGIILDAEQKEHLPAWDRVKEYAQSANPNFTQIPTEMPAEGLVIVNSRGQRLGLWIMPDNKARGMLEDFLQSLVPPAAHAVWEYAVASVNGARTQFAGLCRDVHRQKAYLHAWLALQDPPGERLGAAVSKNVLDPATGGAAQFTAWFKRLFEL